MRWTGAGARCCFECGLALGRGPAVRVGWCGGEARSVLRRGEFWGGARFLLRRRLRPGAVARRFARPHARCACGAPARACSAVPVRCPLRYALRGHRAGGREMRDASHTLAATGSGAGWPATTPPVLRMYMMCSAHGASWRSVRAAHCRAPAPEPYLAGAWTGYAPACPPWQ